MSEDRVPIAEAKFFALRGCLFCVWRWAPVDHGRAIGLCIRARRVKGLALDAAVLCWDCEEEEWVQVERLPKFGLTEEGAHAWWMGRLGRAERC